VTRLGVDRFLHNGELVAGDISIDPDTGTITSIGLPSAGTGRLAAPGFIDLQVNGFGGVDFLHTDLVGIEQASIAVATTGVTSFLPTLITTSEHDRTRALQQLRDARHGPTPGASIIGVHLEGPHLSPKRAGAHPLEDLVSIDDEFAALATEPDRAAPLYGYDVALVTLAADLANAHDLIAGLIVDGVVVSIGHTAATAVETRSAFDAGVTGITHAFNAMPPITGREPGPLGAALADQRVSIMVIADRVHVADDNLRWLAHAARERLVLVTDAIAATHTSDGATTLGSRTVHVSDGTARLDDGTLAGSVLTMDQAVRNLVELDVDLAAALYAASTAPGKFIGRSDLGQIDIGSRADVVVLDDHLQPVLTLLRGEELP